MIYVFRLLSVAAAQSTASSLSTDMSGSRIGYKDTLNYH